MTAESIVFSTEDQVLPTPEPSEYIQDQQDDSYQMSLIAASAADDRKAEDIVILSVAEVSSLADCFVIATGFSKAQVRAIANAIKDKIAAEFDRYPVRTAGESDANWILQDYGDVIVHIMLPTEREFYGLEAFWGHAPKFMLPKSA